MKKVIAITYILILAMPGFSQSSITPFEKSAGKQSSTYFQTIEYYKKLDEKYSTIQLKSFGETDAGYPLHLVTFSADKSFEPKKWQRQGKVIVMINNGIHPGEPDGIDATMMLMRDYASGKIKTPSNVIFAAIAVYNIGGALNRNNFSRVNQQGPESYGFRGNAQNLDLNRDFTKYDSKNAKTFAQIFHYLSPEILVDNHVSDGADYQHTMTLLTSQHSKIGGALGKFLHDEFEPALYKSMHQKNWPMCPYVNFEDANPEKGWLAFYDLPRYSSGYAALFQTIGFVPETHMLKSFDKRVWATYALMQSVVEQSSAKASALKAWKLHSQKEVLAQQQFPLTWVADSSKTDEIKFLGYEPGTKTSEVTGMPRLFYDHSKPFTRQVKYYNYFKGNNIVTAPKFYVIPQGWHEVIDLLKLNNVQLKRLQKDSVINVEAYRIEDYKSSARPYEKHHRNADVVVSKKIQEIRFLKGDYIISTNQSAKRFLIEMLEPTAEDSYFAWNYFDAILQQKEGYSDYRWEDVAAEYIKAHPELKQQLEAKKKADPVFAKSAPAQLNFIYKNSPYYEPAHMRYPVYRIN
ncbi:MAG: hypothetical protein JWQ96_3159 [Segetibacter sp.]|nr:hypothetical protein [Segetibacter sp.]